MPDYLEGWTALAFMLSMTGQAKRVAYVARGMLSVNPHAADTLGKARP
jgi:hypothetical protein